MIRYFPLNKGIYEVVPGLGALGGVNPWDGHYFQFDESFAKARANKIACRKENLGKYFLTQNLPENKKRALVLFLMNQLPLEHSEYFKKTLDSNSQQTLHCSLTGDVVKINSLGDLIEFIPGDFEGPVVTEAIDALALQIQEDVALLSRAEEKEHLALLHLCSPSHWSGQEKIGMSFTEIHAPVPGIELVNRAAKNIINVMIHKGPFVRFVWSFVTDDRLNHHPSAPPGIDPITWRGRSFNADASPPFYLRVERQVTRGFPEEECALFGIRVSFWSGQEIKDDPEKRMQLISSLQSMTPESRVYKGVSHCFSELIEWLENPSKSD
jgi:dimethylamine monooxygenase subunit A